MILQSGFYLILFKNKVQMHSLISDAYFPCKYTRTLYPTLIPYPYEQLQKTRLIYLDIDKVTTQLFVSAATSQTIEWINRINTSTHAKSITSTHISMLRHKKPNYVGSIWLFDICIRYMLKSLPKYFCLVLCLLSLNINIILE